jgi:glycosyltransferase involved in cell wall biosynthesis
MGKTITMMKISVVYATYNEEKNLARSLRSVKDFAAEIIVVDGQSSDQTRQIAHDFHAKVIETTNKPNFHINKQMAIDAATGELILQLDADEVVDSELKKFIIQLATNPSKRIVAWEIKRRNLFFQTWLKKGGQYPDPVIRLFYRSQAYLPQQDVHEQMTVLGKVAVAKGHLLHYANPDLDSYWRKANTYTSFKATQLSDQALPINLRTTLSYLLFKPWGTFFNLFIRHRGYVDGLAGFLFAYFSGFHHRLAFWKYLEQQRSLAHGQIKVFYPPSPVAQYERHRGVGRYSQWLLDNLKRTGKIKVLAQGKNADLIHYLSFDLFRPSLRPPKRGQKLIVTIHDLIPLLFPKDYPVSYRHRLIFIRQKILVRRSHLLITDSSASAKDITRLLKIKAAKIKVVPLAANAALAPASSDLAKRVRQKYTLPQIFLLYVGDINFNKNIPGLIKTLKFLPDQIELVLVGKNFVPASIPEWQVIREQIDLSQVQKRVHFLTKIDDERDLSALYSLALAYVQPSYYEGFGLPILEAMRCQTPVVCANNSSLPEVAGEWAFYSQSTKAEDFAQAIIQVFNLTPAKRHAWVIGAQAWQEQFTWEKTAQTMIEIYQELKTLQPL